MSNAWSVPSRWCQEGITFELIAPSVGVASAAQGTLTHPGAEFFEKHLLSALASNKNENGLFPMRLSHTYR